MVYRIKGSVENRGVRDVHRDLKGGSVTLRSCMDVCGTELRYVRWWY